MKNFLNFTLFLPLLFACHGAHNSNHPSDHPDQPPRHAERTTQDSIPSAAVRSQSATVFGSRLDPLRAGVVTSDEILAYPVFRRNYNTLTIDLREIERFKQLKNMTWVVAFGFWCHDSQREIPRLIKAMQAGAIDPQKVTWIAVTPDKQLPTAFSQNFRLTKTPTIWLLQQEQIIATMIETPRGTLGQDLLSQVLH